MSQEGADPEARPAPLAIGGAEWRFGERTYIMGVLNVTPDSFYAGSRIDTPAAAAAQAAAMADDGADIIDIGGESTRPGAAEVEADEELERVLPVVEAVRGAVDVPVSIDTYKAEVAERAVDAGADLINDVWGLQRDRNMAAVAAEAGVPVVAMHNQEEAVYRDLVEDILSFFRETLAAAERAGLPPSRVILDPGFGFAKTVDHNLEMVRRLGEFRRPGCPLLLGPSRKSTIGAVLDLPAAERLEGTAAVVSQAIAHGIDVVRVHDVREMVRVARMTDALVRGGRQDAAGAAATGAGGGTARDRIDLRGMTFTGRHGVHHWEREQGQKFVVDVAMTLDLSPGGAADDLAATVDYGAVHQAVEAVVTGEPVDLLETLAARVAEQVLEEPVDTVTVTVHKPEAPIDGEFDDVSVTITRGRRRGPRS